VWGEGKTAKMQLAEDFIEGGKLFGDWKPVLGWELSKEWKI